MWLKFDCTLLGTRVVKLCAHWAFRLNARPEPVSVKPNRFGVTVSLPWYPTLKLSRSLAPIRIFDNREFTLWELFAPLQEVW
jgi:hypothetical protein